MQTCHLKTCWPCLVFSWAFWFPTAGLFLIIPRVYGEMHAAWQVGQELIWGFGGFLLFFFDLNSLRLWCQIELLQYQIFTTRYMRYIHFTQNTSEGRLTESPYLELDTIYAFICSSSADNGQSDNLHAQVSSWPSTKGFGKRRHENSCKHPFTCWGNFHLSHLSPAILHW